MNRKSVNLTTLRYVFGVSGAVALVLGGVLFFSRPAEAIYNLGAFWKRAVASLEWPFTAGTEAEYNIASSIELVGGVARLKTADRVDDADAAGGFLDGTKSGVTWDSTNNYLRLANSGGCDGTSSNCNSDDELNSSWTPQWASLKGYWKLNETSGTTIVDSSGNSNNATLSGSVYTLGATANMKTGITSDGQDGSMLISVGNPASLAITGNITVTGWAKIDTGKWGSIYQKGSDWGPGDGWGLHLTSNSPAAGWSAGLVIGSTGYSATATKGYTAGVWHFVAAVRNGTSLVVYVDGEQVATKTVGSGAMRHANGNYIASAANATTGVANWVMNGTIDEVAVWNTALTLPEILTIYNRQLPKRVGTFTSRVMDAFAVGQSWTSMSWVPTLPFLKPLPDYASGAIQNETSTDYSSLVGSTGATGGNDLMTGNVGLWHLDEAAGTTGAGSVADDSGQGNVATPQGTTVFGSSAKLSTGLDLNGTNAYLSIPNNNGSLNITGDITYASWIKITKGSTSSVTIFCGYNTGTYVGYGIGIGQAGVTGAIAIWTGGASWQGGSRAINDGLWHHVAVTLSGTTASFYVDGVLDTTKTQSAPTSHTGVRYIGFQGALYMSGSLDEVAVWNRALHANEVLQLYRRGANRIKYQVRVCTAADCSDDASGANWKGPDGTKTTYFSELNNNTAPLAMTGTFNKGLPSLTFSDFTSPVGTSQYFQYRAVLESDDTSTACSYGSASACSPELKSVTVAPVHRDSSSPAIYGVNGMAYSNLTSLTETLGTCAGGVTYNLSRDKTTWYWWDSSANAGAGGWVNTGSATNSNSAAVITTNAATFRTQVGSGTIYFKAYLKSSSNAVCELDNVKIIGS